MKDPRIEAAAKALNTAGWTCYEGSDEPGQYDECEDCKRYCDTMARAALAAADKAATITTVEELEALPVGTVVSSDGYRYSLTYPNYPVSFQKLYDGLWHRGGRTADTHPELIIPARVIHWGQP